MRVGIISDGAANFQVLTKNHFLPKSIDFVEQDTGEGDEGDWILQIVHRIAPGAQLAFCPGGKYTTTVLCAQQLVDQFHANIVVDDTNPLPVSYIPAPKLRGLPLCKGFTRMFYFSPEQATTEAVTIRRTGYLPRFI